ncbi:MAG: ATP-binding protein [Methanoregula sp.]
MPQISRIPGTLFSRLCPTLAIVFLFMAVLMTVFELAKQFVVPAVTIWQSHLITIGFTSIIAVIIMAVPLSAMHREQQRSEEALVHRKEAEERLRTSEMQYHSFVESVEDSIYTVDRDLRYLLINTRHLIRKGLLPETYAGKSYGDFHTAEETAVFRAEVTRVLMTKAGVQDEYEKEGKHFLRKLHPVFDSASNTITAVTVISTEITKRKTAERNLEAINRKLNLMNEITRHDILNQLTVLNSYLSLAEEQSADAIVKKYLLRSEHVSDTIYSQILFTRDYQNIGISSPQWQNLCATIQRARHPLKIPSVAFEGAFSSLEIFADPLLEKVFFNLMDNSLRYAGPHALIRFSCIEEERVLRIICEDDGPGIPSDQKEKIFARGFGRNSGMGLFLIREILSITGIAIYENGEPGSGSRFEMIVPSRHYRQRAGE